MTVIGDDSVGDDSVVANHYNCQPSNIVLCSEMNSISVLEKMTIKSVCGDVNGSFFNRSLFHRTIQLSFLVWYFEVLYFIIVVLLIVVPPCIQLTTQHANDIDVYSHYLSPHFILEPCLNKVMRFFKRLAFLLTISMLLPLFLTRPFISQTRTRRSQTRTRLPKKSHFFSWRMRLGILIIPYLDVYKHASPPGKEDYWLLLWIFSVRLLVFDESWGFEILIVSLPVFHLRKFNFSKRSHFFMMFFFPQKNILWMLLNILK